MMEAIDVIFVLEGKRYHGQLSFVMGAGGHHVYHLMVDNFYYGQVIKNERWQYGGQLEGIKMDIEQVMEQITKAKEILLPDAIAELKRDLFGPDLNREKIITWWKERNWIFAPVECREILEELTIPR